MSYLGFFLLVMTLSWIVFGTILWRRRDYWGAVILYVFAVVYGAFVFLKGFS